jgi:hypothetical protein
MERRKREVKQKGKNGGVCARVCIYIYTYMYIYIYIHICTYILYILSFLLLLRSVFFVFLPLSLHPSVQNSRKQEAACRERQRHTLSQLHFSFVCDFTLESGHAMEAAPGQIEPPPPPLSLLPVPHPPPRSKNGRKEMKGKKERRNEGRMNDRNGRNRRMCGRHFMRYKLIDVRFDDGDGWGGFLYAKLSPLPLPPPGDDGSDEDDHLQALFRMHCLTASPPPRVNSTVEAEKEVEDEDASMTYEEQQILANIHDVQRQLQQVKESIDEYPYEDMEENVDSPAETQSPQFKSKTDTDPPVKPPAGRLIIVSNRLPMTVTVDSHGEYVFNKSSGGLVTALKGVKDLPFIWIGWLGKFIPPKDHDKIRKMLWKNHRLSGLPNCRCMPVFLEKEMADKFYNGFCNNVLWPVFHYEPLPMYKVGASGKTAKKFDFALWQAYFQANKVCEVPVPIFLTVLVRTKLVFLTELVLTVLSHCCSCSIHCNRCNTRCTVY